MSDDEIVGKTENLGKCMEKIVNECVRGMIVKGIRVWRTVCAESEVRALSAVIGRRGWVAASSCHPSEGIIWISAYSGWCRRR